MIRLFQVQQPFRGEHLGEQGVQGQAHADFVPKAHFQLIGVYVYVHRRGGHGEGEHAHGVHSDGDPAPAGVFQGLLHQGAAHHPTVDEQGLLGPGGPGAVPHADEALHPQGALGQVHRGEGGGHLAAVHRQSGVAQVAVPVALEYRLAPVDQLHRHLGISQQQPAHRLHHHPGLIGRLF